jgi:hypothetical protein
MAKLMNHESAADAHRRGAGTSRSGGPADRRPASRRDAAGATRVSAGGDSATTRGAFGSSSGTSDPRVTTRHGVGTPSRWGLHAILSAWSRVGAPLQASPDEQRQCKGALRLKSRTGTKCGNHRRSR